MPADDVGDMTASPASERSVTSANWLRPARSARRAAGRSCRCAEQVGEDEGRIGARLAAFPRAGSSGSGSVQAHIRHARGEHRRCQQTSACNRRCLSRDARPLRRWCRGTGAMTRIISAIRQDLHQLGFFYMRRCNTGNYTSTEGPSCARVSCTPSYSRQTDLAAERMAVVAAAPSAPLGSPSPAHRPCRGRWGAAEVACVAFASGRRPQRQ